MYIIGGNVSSSNGIVTRVICAGIYSGIDILIPSRGLDHFGDRDPGGVITDYRVYVSISLIADEHTDEMR